VFWKNHLEGKISELTGENNIHNIEMRFFGWGFERFNGRMWL
jgi:hypothetical protein